MGFFFQLVWISRHSGTLAYARPVQQWRKDRRRRERARIHHDYNNIWWRCDSLSRLHSNIGERLVLFVQQVRTFYTQITRWPSKRWWCRRLLSFVFLSFDLFYFYISSRMRRKQQDVNSCDCRAQPGSRCSDCSGCLMASIPAGATGEEDGFTRRRHRHRPHHKGRSFDPHRPSCSSQSSSDLSSPSDSCYSFVRKALQVSLVDCNSNQLFKCILMSCE